MTTGAESLSLSMAQAPLNAFVVQGGVRTAPPKVLTGQAPATQQASTSSFGEVGSTSIATFMAGGVVATALARQGRSKAAKSQKTVVAAFESELGVQAPTGFFDPLGLAKDGSEENFKRRRASEIKHGRIAMLATMGYITPELTGKFPGYLSPSSNVKYADIPNGLGAIAKVPFFGWVQILAYAAFVEFSGMQSNGIYGTSGTPGDFGFKVLSSKDPEGLKKKLNSELANGRLAMMAIIGMFFQDGLTGSAYGDWALYTDSPLRAFESELGVQAPTGFFDPLGLAKDGSEENFKRRRASEIKHGRIAMLATMGYITPELTGKFPGYLSPSSNLKYADIPNGLGAIAKVPFLGWVQILSYAAFVEFSGMQSNGIYGTSGTPGDFGFKVLSSKDPEGLKKKLNSELANGRLAMMAIIGMFFQDGLTGSAYGDWALYTDSPLRAFESELGVQAPTGFFDPLGLAKDGSEENFKRRRASEIKHGRIAMLATMGYITPELTGKFPGYLSPSSNVKYADIPNGLGAIAKVPFLGWVQILAYAAFVEFSGMQSNGIYGTSGTPGDFGFKVLSSKDPEGLKKKLNSELANGRLAMMAIIGMFFQDGLTGSAYGDWALYTDSPLRAFESELGVQAPTGFFDPLGYAKDGSEENFKRRRASEIKHGRIAMLATMGYITPELTGKFPGYLSPSSNVKYSDIPNGLGAIAKVPFLGWVQILAYAAFVEFSGMQSNGIYGTSGTPGDFGFKVLTSKDPEGLKKKLNSELANGRLAMMAIIGMFFQDGLTGSAYGDWALYTDSPLRAFESELGVQAPTGFFDPLGYAKDGSEENFKRRRASEIKHGRIAMLATMGYITPELTGKFPGYLSPSSNVKYADIPNGLGAIAKVPFLGWVQILAYAAFVEFSGMQSNGIYGTSGTPGDFGFKVLTSKDPEGLKKKLNSELANGRLAMMAIIGMFFQDGLTGSAYGDWALYTDSPLRAFESELGVQAPTGFFDPLGLAKDGSEENFKRRRSSEIKHGRIAMLATMGYITPELTGKFPGYLSPSSNVKYADIPNGLGAIAKVPFLGWVQILAYAAFVEFSGMQSNGIYGTSGTPGDFGFKVLTSKDPEGLKKKLNSELANGRLAMMAIMGMFFQDGLTGSAYGDWALYTDSPLRAFESELGVQAPTGFFDPLGLAKDGSEENFKRRRASEIKHGRIAMLATMGYITPELTGKFPGYLSPSSNVKYADIPNGLGAIAKVPFLGWVQILAYAAFVEFSGMQSNGIYGTSGTPGDFGFKVLSAKDPEALKKKLNSELANGRLAMMAIMGMFFQDGLTGSAYGDWALYTDSPLR